MDSHKLLEINDEALDVLKMHRISPELGFLGEKPPLHLPYDHSSQWRNEYFRKLDALAYNLPELIRTKTLHHEIVQLSIPPELHLEQLSWAAQNRFMLLNAMVTHALFVQIYNYPDVSTSQKDEKEKYLLPALAIPLWEISKLTGFVPTLSYGLYIRNYELLDPQKPVALDNLDLLHSFTGSVDEKWFVWIHQVVEKEFAPAISALLSALLLTSHPDTPGMIQEVTKCLARACMAMRNVVSTLHRMREHCDPATYFQRVRMFYSFPRNVIFGGVREIEGKAQNYFGETGGQSPFMHTLLASLGIYPADPYFPQMRKHMSKYNRSFVELILHGSHLREYVKRHAVHRPCRPLLNYYHMLVDFVLGWRKEHLSLVDDNIGKYGDKHGTGSPPLSWLRGLYDETLRYRNEF